MDGNRRNFTSSLTSSQAAREPRTEQHQKQQHGPTSNHSLKSNVHSTTKQSGNGSTKSNLYDNQGHKNLSSSFGMNSNQNGPKQQQQQQQFQHHPNHPVTVFSDKTQNNVGHKASQTKRIQLSTAAKRCKSINRSKAVDNNNSKTINLDDICKADDVAGKELKEKDDDNCVTVVNTPHQRHNTDTETLATNSISNQSTDSPTLVKVKTWYTESSVALPLSQDVIF